MKEFFNSDTAVGRGCRTFLQVVIAVALAVWKIPGVPETVYRVVQENALVTVPVLTGVVTVIWNILRKDVENV